MSSNRNGFADAINQLNKVVKVDQNVTIEVLKQAAEYFTEELKKVIPVGNGTNHLKDEIQIVVKNDLVQVIFSDKAWYWHLAEHGHKKANGRGRVKGHHFVRNTVNAHKKKIEEMLVREIINRMEG